MTYGATGQAVQNVQLAGSARKRSKRSKSLKFSFLQVVENMERETGIEPATNSLEGCDSTIELLPRFNPTTYIIPVLRRISSLKSGNPFSP